MAMPFFFAGAKVAITLSVIGAVVGEFVGSDKGLGYIILSATSYWKTARRRHRANSRRQATDGAIAHVIAQRAPARALAGLVGDVHACVTPGRA